ncbi:filament-forming protein [Pseudozyma hubeiensis SY62]|uniref:Filament-forming protein n=1 Tax=Pseudozyma hubeiensis (strain SY62) TaxID=1305764 RepID=R9P7G2_PSEHS|nr:filament-forming protein [Pseudozyma hubeiensis SY62]GAC97197.1 filament-forming protein [Pseudozyma hubeiensis SY62]
MADSNPAPDAQEIQRLVLAAADAANARSAEQQPLAPPSTDITMQDSTAPPASDASPTAAGLPSTTSLHVQLPPHISADQLVLALTTLSEAEPSSIITAEQLQSPDADLVLRLYDIVIKALGWKQQVSVLQEAQQEARSSLTAAQDANRQLEQQLEADSAQTVEASRLKDSLQTEVVNLQNQIGSLQTSLDNERREGEAAKERSAELATELSASQAQTAALIAEVETERKAKELVRSEKDRLSAELVGVSAQLTTLKSSTESGVRQAAEVRGRLDQAEQEKRDILSSLQREREESTRKAEEINTLLSRNRDARQEISRLSTAVQESRSQENTARFKLQGLEQEIKLTKKDAEWAHEQLNKLNEASATFRAAKRAELSRVQAELDTARQEAAASRSKVESLQTAYNEASTKLGHTSDKVADLSARLASQEASFRSEVGSQSQLVKLLERRAEHSSQRIVELEEQWEDVLAQCRTREQEAWAETQKEVELRQALQDENRELSEALDRLAEGVGIGQGQRENGDAFLDQTLDIMSDVGADFDTRSIASTPRRTGLMGTAASFNNGFGISPTAEIANRIRKSGKSFSQIYMELAKTQEELRRERLETTRLGSVLAQVMDELQERAPQLQAQREETERLTADLGEMVAQVATASQERDTAQSDAKRLKLDLERISRENGFMSQQLADFGRQVRELTKAIILRDDPDAAARLEDDGSFLAELDAIGPLPETLPESDTQSVITSELVTFQSLTELCSQNARLLQVTRQLGAKMEEEERNYKARLADEEDDAVNEARDLIVRLEDEVRQERYKMEEVSKERDLFRQLCSTGGRSAEAKAGEEHASGAIAPINSGLPLAEYEALRARHERLKTETDNELSRYREEIRSLQVEISKTTVSSAREQALRQAAEDKFGNLQRTHELTRTDLDELSKRTTKLQESLARKEVSAQMLEEQLIQSQSSLEQLRTQVSSLQAEKEVWKSLESNLLEENRGMQVERNNLQELVRTTQSMQSDLEERGRDVKSRLEQDVKRLDEINEDLRSRLAAEQDLYRQLSLRREIETKDLQSRIDLSSAELSSAREALAIARTSADHTQLRVEDLTRQLESTQEKLGIYERRDKLSRDPVAFRAQADVQLSREEQLEIELADLKAGRAAAQLEVRKSKLEVEQATAAVAEKDAALSALSQELEQLKTSTSSELSSRTADIEGLQQQLSSASSQLSAVQTQLQELQLQLQTERSAFQAEKKSLEDAITELGSVEERARAEQEDVKGEIRKHVQAAKAAQLKLDDMTKQVETLTADLAEAREQLKKARQDASSLRSSKDLAEAEWGREKASWDAVRQALEREKADLQRKIDDLTTQNQILHTHLETINAQANQMREAAAAPLPSVDVDMDLEQASSAVPTTSESTADPNADEAVPAGAAESREAAAEGASEIPAEAAATTDAPSSEPAQAAEVKKEDTSISGTELAHSLMKRRVDELHEVVKFLRREKEIVDLQMEINKQETSRLKQTLEHVNKTLGETRSELDSERTKNVSSASTATQHAELLEKINQLNELRENHNTLQETASRADARIAQLESELRTANAELEPVQEQLRNAQIELEASQAELNVMREDSKRWQSRAQSLLQTHGMNEEMQKVEQQRAEAQQKVEETEAKLKESEAATATAKQNFEKLREQVRTRIATERKAVAEVQEKLAALQKEKEEDAAKYQEAIAVHEANIAQLVIERDALKQQLVEAQAAAATAAEGTGGSAAPVAGEENSSVPAAAASETREAISSVDQQAAVEAAFAEAQKQFDEIKAKLEAEKEQIILARDKHLQKGKQFLREKREAEAEVQARDATIAQLKSDFAENNAEAIEKAVQERLAAGGNGVSGVGAAYSESEVAALRLRIAELEEKLAAAEERIRELEAQLASAQSGVPTDVTELKAAHAQELQELKASLEAKYAQAPPASTAADGDVESQVQLRLKALEDEREAAVQEAIAAAVSAREAELKAQYDESAKARFEAGKNEANLRNTLMIKQKDNKINKLTAEIAALKGEEVPAAAQAAGGGAPTGPAGGAAGGGASRPGVFGRGAAQAGRATARPVVARPIPTGPASATSAAGAPTPTPTTVASIRGAAAAGRGGGTRIAHAAARGGRGGAATAGAKRKLSAQGLNAAAPNAEAGQGGAKKPRAAGAPIAIKKPGQGGQGGQGQ